jgi:hypothetical protein
MNKPVPTKPERPLVPWGGLVIGALAVFGAFSLIGFVIHTVWALVKVAVVIVIALAVINLIVGRKATR